jgi:hypothetical protein
VVLLGDAAGEIAARQRDRRRELAAGRLRLPRLASGGGLGVAR